MVVMGVYLAEPIADTIAVCTTAPMFYVYYRLLSETERGELNLLAFEN